MTQSYWFFGSRLVVLADAGLTGGRYDLIEGLFPPGAQTPLPGTPAPWSSCTCWRASTPSGPAHG